ncbi:diaminopimelate epimerase [Buchnera aphidicola (Takecallis taiwana)]|uniref:diaminopimelate epimerase n=1 Tax=Buchnera aphidicola TaxID=9 RepID=UPI0031B683AB
MLNQNKVLNFSKMHGLGNDFVILDRINQEFNLSKQVIQKISNRNTGIGFDQLLIVEHAKNIKYDFYYRIFNSDGSEVAQCGNGARCFAYFIYLKKMTIKTTLMVQTQNSHIIIQIINKNNIIVNMGKPQFNLLNIPKFILNNFRLNTFTVNDCIIKYGTIFIGNPHFITIVKNIKNYPVCRIGKILNNHSFFPDGINVNYMQVVSNEHIILRVYERGVGETQACGSGACASVVFGIIQGILKNHVIVTLPGGDLQVRWNGFGHDVYMTGPAEYVYDGYISERFFKV